jgi:hypothetical protein
MIVTQIWLIAVPIPRKCNQAEPPSISAHSWPMPAKLRKQGFGQPSKDHWLTTEPSAVHHLLFDHLCKTVNKTS